jgi:hypothetical protein
VQGRHDKGFAERVFTYNYRLYDRYRQPIASLAVLADMRAGWRPESFGYTLFGCDMAIRFPVAKLSDYAARIDQLLEDQNAFALITAAHLRTQQTKGKGSNDTPRNGSWCACCMRESGTGSVSLRCTVNGGHFRFKQPAPLS